MGADVSHLALLTFTVDPPITGSSPQAVGMPFHFWVFSSPTVPSPEPLLLLCGSMGVLAALGLVAARGQWKCCFEGNFYLKKYPQHKKAMHFCMQITPPVEEKLPMCYREL